MEQLRSGIEKYKDYHVALADGFHIFLPNVPQPEYHFTSYRNGLLAGFSFDRSRPTSLLYRKTSTGYELVGAMYTMPKRATEEQLNARVPLEPGDVAPAHESVYAARAGLKNADWSKFGLQGSIASKDACDAAGGRFSSVIFGWMVHVYPYEDSLDKIFAMHHHMDCTAPFAIEFIIDEVFTALTKIRAVATPLFPAAPLKPQGTSPSSSCLKLRICD